MLAEQHVGSELEASPSVRAAKLLISAIRRLAGARTLEAISETVRSTARQLVDADGATFVLRDGEECFYLEEDAISTLWKGQRFPLTACVSGWVMLHQEQVAMPDIYADARVPHDVYRPTFVKSLVMTPVRRDPAFAAIGTYWSLSRKPSPAELALLQDLADATAVALENVEVYVDLERRVEERTQELVALNRELEAFSYSVAHDLRSPLTAIAGFAELAGTLYGASMTPQLHGFMEHIVEASQSMNDIISGLLDFAQCTRDALSRAPIDISALSRQISERLAREAAPRQVELTIEPDLVAHGDPRLLSVVLTNLLSNAFKYTRDQAAAKVSFGQVQDAGTPTFFVRDNGAGFSPAAASRLFAPFQRLHTAQQFEGIGIGLATVARIVRKHGGEVWAEAQAGKGATFFFSLPVDIPPES